MSSSLAHLAEKAVKWSAVTTAGRFVLQLGAQVALARLLGPGNYGAYGIGFTILTFATFLSGSAFSYSLLLQPSVSEADVRFAFTWQTAAGIACALAMALAAAPLAHWFSDARVEPVLHWLALACVMAAMSAPAVCLLQRDLDFRAWGLIQIGSYALGYLAVGVPLALLGWGAQTLAIALVVQTAVTLVACYWLRPHSLRPLWHHANGAEQIGTGRIVFFTNIVNWALTTLDRVIIGRLLNAHAVGLFALAYNVAQIPTSVLVTAVQPALLASGAKMANDPERLGKGWRLVMASVLVLLLPGSILLALVAQDLVGFLYGDGWLEAAWYLALMFLCMPAFAAAALSTPVLWNTGRKHFEVLLQLPLLALALPAWWLLTPMGLRWAAVISAMVVHARALSMVAACLRALGLRWKVLGQLALRGALLAMWTGAATLAGAWAVAGVGHHAASFLAGSLAGGLALLAVVVAAPQLLGEEARLTLSRVLPFVSPGAAAATAAAGAAGGQP